MELEEAIRIMEEWSSSYYQEVGENDDSLAIDTVLQALENSIPKKKIEDKINKRVTKLYAERDDNSDYDFEIQLWKEMKQELLEKNKMNFEKTRYIFMNKRFEFIDMDYNLTTRIEDAIAFNTLAEAEQERKQLDEPEKTKIVRVTKSYVLDEIID